MKLFVILLFSVFAIPCHPKTPSDSRLLGKVIRIEDGDTFDLLVVKSTYRIRLSDVDCPERKQDYYEKCKEALADLCFSNMVTVINNGKDRYGRIIGKVYTAKGLCVNQELVRNGYAWNFIKYSTDPELARMEETATGLKLGLWSQPNPIAPWEYRKLKQKMR